MKRLGKYELLEQLGRGGYGTVYRALDTVLEVERAVKVLHPPLAADPHFIERFQKEAKTAAKLDHPNIVRVYDLDEVGGRYFLVMEYMPGGSLKDRISREGHLSLEDALRITEQIASALQYANDQDLVHRDIKPGNILFYQDGIAKLSDFGFSKALSGSSSATLSLTGGVIGTPAYMAPEVWENEPVGTFTDEYSLACVFYEAITGEVLFNTESAPAVIMRKHFKPLVLPEQWPEGVPGKISVVFETALAKDPQERFQDGLELIQAVKELVRLEDVQETIKQEEAKFRQVLVERNWAQAAIIISKIEIYGETGKEKAVELRDELAKTQQQRHAYLKKVAGIQAEGIQAVSHGNLGLAETKITLLQSMGPEGLAAAEKLQKKVSSARRSAERGRKWAETRSRIQPYFKRVAIVVGILIMIFVTCYLLPNCPSKPIPPPQLTEEPDQVIETEPPDQESTEEIKTVIVEESIELQSSEEPIEPAVETQETKTDKPPSYAETGDTQVSPIDGMTMVYVPEGEFLMGSKEDDPDAYADEKPQHPVYLDTFWIDRTEVTNAMFAQFLNEEGNQSEGGAAWLNARDEDVRLVQSGSEWQPVSGYGEHPVVEVTWYGARAYCNWAGRRLPSETEWEKAARGVDGRSYPMGESIDCSVANYRKSCVGDITPVGSYPNGASPFGTLDMAGNVMEWVDDWYNRDYSPKSPSDNPSGLSSREYIVIRGGSWDQLARNARTYVRDWYEAKDSWYRIGFRCALSDLSNELNTTSSQKMLEESTLPLKPEKIINSGQGRVRHVAISYDNRLIASTGDGGSINIWEVASEERIYTFNTNSLWINCIDISLDGTILAAGAGNITLWDLKSGKRIRDLALKNFTDWVECLAFSPREMVLASGSRLGFLDLWEISSYEFIHNFPRQESEIWSLSFSKDGQLIATGSQDRFIRIWGVKEKKLLRIIQTEALRTLNLAISPDGKTLASVLSYGNTSTGNLTIWDIDNGQELMTLSENITDVDFSINGELIAASGVNGYIKIFEVANWQELYSLKGHESSIRDIVFSSDGLFLISGGVDGKIILWGAP